MREKTTFVDEEFKEIAGKLLKKFPRFFPEDFNLDRFYFIRTEAIKPNWISRVRKIGHPWGSMPGLEDLIYLVETSAENWEPLTEAQRVLVVFHEMKHIPEGGCDYDSNNCGKTDDHPVQDFPECIAAANGNLFWYQVGHGDDLPNILESGRTHFNLEEALKRTGFLGDESRKPLKSPEELSSDDDEDIDEDLASAMIEDMKERSHKSEVEKIKRTAVITESEGTEENDSIVVDEI